MYQNYSFNYPFSQCSVTIHLTISLLFLFISLYSFFIFLFCHNHIILQSGCRIMAHFIFLLITIFLLRILCFFLALGFCYFFAKIYKNDTVCPKSLHPIRVWFRICTKNICCTKLYLLE